MGVFLNGLSLIFVIAKLFGAVSWSWWLVFVPTYIYLVMAIVYFIAVWKLID